MDSLSTFLTKLAIYFKKGLKQKMKDLIGQFGWVVLGIVIVSALILGMMKDQAEDYGKTTNDRLSEISSPIE